MRESNNGFYPKIVLDDGRVINSIEDLRPEERIPRLEKNLETEEAQARVFLKHYQSKVSRKVLNVCKQIVSGNWRTEPLAVISYKEKYRAITRGSQHETIFEFLNDFYASLYSVFKDCNLIEEPDDE